MFMGASSFNIDISAWNVGSVIDMSYMFGYARSFDKSLCWNVASDTNTTHLFHQSGTLASLASFQFGTYPARVETKGALDSSCFASPTSRLWDLGRFSRFSAAKPSSQLCSILPPNSQTNRKCSDVRVH